MLARPVTANRVTATRAAATRAGACPQRPESAARRVAAAMLPVACVAENSMAKDDDGSGKKLKRKDYDERLRELHVELVKLQEWVKHKGLKVCIVFEGRDGAGKGGTI